MTKLALSNFGADETKPRDIQIFRTSWLSDGFSWNEHATTFLTKYIGIDVRNFYIFNGLFFPIDDFYTRLVSNTSMFENADGLRNFQRRFIKRAINASQEIYGVDSVCLGWRTGGESIFVNADGKYFFLQPRVYSVTAEFLSMNDFLDDLVETEFQGNR